ncbi:AAA family ATPase [Streptomyces sp. ADI98-10]|uniref:AAA family ATPase n=1 Tax=Streptomyces sp. ADI98-10 TaxID=1522763 RepID=UPI000F553491|nr:AAA family ATPase [Streptomyces sp. ADI98-10]
MSGLSEERAADLAEAEDAVAGTLLHPEAKDLVPDLVNMLAGSDFASVRLGELWDLLSSMWAAGDGPVDPITVGAELKKRGEVTRLCGPAGVVWLHQLHDAVPTVAHAPAYADIVREESQWRALGMAAARTMSAVQQRTGTAVAAAEAAVESARAVRDQQVQRLDDAAEDLLDFLAEADDEPEWVIPGVLARWDRLMITAGEGGGKSLMLRQILMRAAAGFHPWKAARIAPVRVLHIDAENAKDQARPWLRRMAQAAEAEGAPIERGRFSLRMIPEGLDVTQAADRAWLARMVEQTRPDLISIGSLYKLTTNAKNDEEAARSVMAALEMVRKVSGGAAMILEAHAPHAHMGKRDLRPIGSSLWMRWPEYGFGLAPADPVKNPGAQALRLMDWVPWRGPRSERDWPEQFCEGARWPWQAIQHRGNAPVGTITLETLTAEQAAAAGLIPQPSEPEPFWDDQQIQ